MNADRKAIVERVKKLLALGDKERNPSVAEAEAAFARAQALIEKYQLDLDEIDFAADPGLFDTKRFKRFDHIYRKRIVFQWEKWLASAVAMATGTRHVMAWSYEGHTHWPTVAFVAHENDGDVVLAMYASIVEVAKHVQRRWLDDNGLRGFSKHANDFLEGFATGVYRRAKADAEAAKQRSASSSRALMVIDKGLAVLKAEAELFPNAKEKRSKRSRGSASYYAGREKGEERVLSRGNVGNANRRIGP